MKNYKENYNIGFTNSKQNDLFSQEFSDRKNVIKIDLASECYGIIERKQNVVLTPRLNKQRNLNSFKRFKTVNKDSRLLINDYNFPMKKSLSSFFNNKSIKFDEKIMDVHNCKNLTIFI